MPERIGQLPILWMCKEGTIEWEQIGPIETVEETDIVADKSRNEIVTYTIPSEESFEFTVNAVIPRKTIFMLFMGGNRRAVRRAIRWYEKLRRKELKSGIIIADKVWNATFKAHEHWTWKQMRMEK